MNKELTNSYEQLDEVSDEVYEKLTWLDVTRCPIICIEADINKLPVIDLQHWLLTREYRDTRNAPTRTTEEVRALKEAEDNERRSSS